MFSRKEINVSEFVSYLFSDLIPALPVELLAVIYLCYGVIILKAIVDLVLIFVRSVCRVR